MSCGCTQEGWRIPTRAVPPRPSCWRSSINSHAARLFFSFLFYTAFSDQMMILNYLDRSALIRQQHQADDEFNFMPV